METTWTAKNAMTNPTTEMISRAPPLPWLVLEGHAEIMQRSNDRGHANAITQKSQHHEM
jgi:hypothetical protein